MASSRRGQHADLIFLTLLELPLSTRQLALGVLSVRSFAIPEGIFNQLIVCCTSAVNRLRNSPDDELPFVPDLKLSKWIRNLILGLLSLT